MNEHVAPRLLHGVSAALADSDRVTRSLHSWQSSVDRVGGASVGHKVSRALKHASLPLIEAVRSCDGERLAACLAETSAADVDRRDAAGLTAMAWAAKLGDTGAIRALLAAGASPNLGGEKPAVAEGGEGEGGEGDAPPADDAQPPLYLALVKGRLEAAQLLLDSKADPCESEPLRGQSSLHAAVSANAPAAFGAEASLQMLTRLLEAFLAVGAPTCATADGGADGSGGEAPRLLPADAHGYTPLHTAAAGGRDDCVALLLSHTRSAAAELTRTSESRVTPLAAACRRGHTSVARMLRAHGAPLDPLAVTLCLSKGRRGLLEELRGATGGAAVASAGEAVSAAAAAAADNAGDDDGAGGGGGGVDFSFDDGVTALMLAIEGGEEEVAIELLSLGADAAASDRDGHTPLHRAAWLGHAKLVGALIGAGAPVDAVDLAGNSAMHHAGRGSQEWVFDLLELKHGADAELRNHKGEAPKLSAEPCRMQ